MKKRKISVFLLCAAVCALITAFCCAFAGCGKKDDNWFTDDADNPYMTYSDDIKYRFTVASEEDCPAGNIDDTKIYANASLNGGEAYFLVFDCSVRNYNWTKMDTKFDIIVELSSIKDMSVTLQEANTSVYDEYTDGDTQVITTTYNLPQDRNSPGKYRIVYKLDMKESAMIAADVSFDGHKFSESYRVGLRYTFVSDYSHDGYKLNSMEQGSGRIKNLSVLESYKSHPVTAIGSGAFKNADIPYIIIPDSVLNIESSAFADCQNLERIELSQNIEYINDELFLNCSALESVTIPEKVKSIGQRAFSNCVSLKNITIPGAVARISEGAFKGCENLSAVSIPSSVTEIGTSAFEGDLNLSSLSIAAGVNTVNQCAFKGCEKLKSAAIPESVTSIGYGVFSGCTNLESLTVPFVGDGRNNYNGNNTLGYIFGVGGRYDNTEAVPQSLKTVTVTGGDCINSGAFGDCVYIQNVYLPATIETIFSKAFYGCAGLTSITIPAGVEIIGGDAFAGCGELDSVAVDGDNATFESRNNCVIKKSDKTLILGCNNSVIPSDVVKISGYAFNDCAKLKTITIPASVQSIGEAAFGGCGGLESITVDGDNEYYYSESNCLIDKESKELLLGCNASVIPNNVVAIGSKAFKNCAKLSSIVIPARVTSIGSEAFENCASLGTITIPERVNSIGAKAFAGCASLTRATFEKTEGWEVGYWYLKSEKLADAATAAKYLTDDYAENAWQADD